MALKIGLVGCGNWGRKILRDVVALDCTVFVADISHDARERASARGAVGVWPDASRLPSCDGYVVAVPIPDLAPVCAGLLPRKKPVFCEKTLCTSMESADELERLGGRDYIFAMHKWRYHPGIEALRRVVLSGRIGPLKELFALRHGWVTDFHGGDVFWTLAVHDVTIVRHIFGEIPNHVSQALVRHDENGVAVSLTASIGEGPTLTRYSVSPKQNLASFQAKSSSIGRPSSVQSRLRYKGK